jgi:hypothetical protein
MTCQAQMNKLRSATQITVARWEGLQMPVLLQDAVRTSSRLLDRVERGEKVTTSQIKGCFGWLCAQQEA